MRQNLRRKESHTGTVATYVLESLPSGMRRPVVLQKVNSVSEYVVIEVFDLRGFYPALVGS
jgi:hypothetical protein